ncbi:MAG TPA: hypothetical protein VG407_05810 [Caulobacteraceae bacterium]|jgi:hypothetical protein|nr:hypothetical protein [Caulobacteraceae bacterium]
MVKYQNGDIIQSWADGVAGARDPDPAQAPAAAEPPVMHAPEKPGIPPKTLRAVITVDMEAGDYIEAAEHQASLQATLARIREDYPGAWLTLGGRHKRGDGEAGRRPRLLRPSGRLNAYE